MNKLILRTFSMAVLVVVAQGVMAKDLPRVAGLAANNMPEPKPGFIETHNAIESQSLRISLASNLSGFVEGKVCDECESIKVTITPQSKAFNKSVEVPLINAKNRIGRYATVIYELKSKNVTAIHW